jgi:hypothetical protein
MEANVLINGAYFPNEVLVEMVRNLEPNQVIMQGADVIAFYTHDTQDEVDFDFSMMLRSRLNHSSQKALLHYQCFEESMK